MGLSTVNVRKRAWGLACVVASVLVAPTGTVAAHAEPTVDVRTFDGSAVAVGDVIAVGDRSGSTCNFPDGVGVLGTLTTGSASTTLRIDNACRISVEAIESSTDTARLATWSTEPKHPDGASASVPVEFPSTGAIYDVVAMIEFGKPPKTPEPPEPVNLFTGSAVQTFSNAAGQEQWKDEISLDYAQGVNSGEIKTSSIGDHTDCAVQAIDPTTTYTNVKSNCTYHHTAVSGPYAELTGSGDYQQLLLGQTLASTTTEELFIVTKTNYTGSCPVPRTAPAGWTLSCDWGRS